ncbi:hypothetical protein BKA82DRAFT_4331782 [Pisolithus tinctorius]|nr:hypothetical protein BKA82DRAFT_4331782 [Pisolithus tinctorius]
MSEARISFPRLAFYLETIFLFTRSDYKTIFFPVIIFATATAPSTGAKQLIHTAIWVMTADEARRFRWFLLVVCLCLSAWHGAGVLLASTGLSLVEIFHDDFGFSSDPVLKNLCNVGGYLTFESGAILILSSKTSVDHTSLVALLSSGLLIFTTIHAQDFADADGDRLSGRRTLPIVAPEGSRLYMLTALPVWSIVLSALWDLGPMCGTLFLVMGLFVGSQYFRFRDVQHDQSSYLLYNVWLLAAHVLPMNARSRILIW